MYSIEEDPELPLIIVRNMLPQAVVEEILDEIASIQQHFGKPTWSDAGKDVSGASHAHTLCNGLDVWLPQSNISTPVLLRKFPEFLFHQGILEFFGGCRSDSFIPIPLMHKDGRIHVINYTNGGYYNWHKDIELGRGGQSYLVHTTFALSLARESPQFEGGESMYMYRNKVRTFPFTNNQLLIFPSHVTHAASEVKMDPEGSFMDGRFNIQFWLTGGLANWSKVQPN